MPALVRRNTEVAIVQNPVAIVRDAMYAVRSFTHILTKI